MKVIRVVSELDFGGVEQVLANSIPEIAGNKEMDISIIVLGKGGKVAQELIQQGIMVNVLNLNPRIPNFGLILKLKQIFLESNPEVVHSQGAEANFHGILAANWAGIKRIVGEEIGIPNHHSYWKYIFRWVYSKAHVIIGISEAVKTAMVGMGEVKEEKVLVVYNPVSEVKRDRLDAPKNENAMHPTVFVTTGRLVKIKNLDTLLKVFSKLVHDNPQKLVELWIVGDGPERQHLEQLAFDLEINDKVKFFGFQEDVYSVLKQADYFVLPSFSEGSSVSLVEAMVSGLPSIVTEVGGTLEILGSSQSGVLINPRKSTSILDAMNYFLNFAESEKIELGQRAKIEAQRFSVQSYLNHLLQIYQFPG
ncbi:MAG: glycosyltransferase [Cyclobacterium sp.]|uniref:glycosyltransferase n=1 Tax=unclassified Cyclobacterium TaxID=2615055 RepID=UPI0013D5DFCC|nr:glycosyltransferase [Cyclobacterium sp. SYSU L10401]